MKLIVAALVAAICLLLSACTTTAELKAIEAQKDIALATIKFNDDSETRAARAWIEVTKAREATRQEEAKAAVVKAGAIMKIAEKADAGGRVAMARSLEERAPAAGAAVAEVAMPKPSFMSVPTIQLPKSVFEKGVDMVDRLWGRANGTADSLLAYKGLGKRLDAEVRRTELIEKGNTDRHASTMGAFGRFSDNQASQANESTRGFAQAFVEESKNPDQVFNIGGNDNQLALGGSRANRVVTTTINTVDCPQTQTANGGQSGSGGTGGNGQGTTAGSNGGQGAPSGAGGAPQPQQRGECNAGK
ncbi:MAG: hypothetical protein ACRDAM_15825 [Casimicrobium sp.]